jgi:pyridoxine/pyridoxamine 5'-phosphate oxidase
MKIADLRIECVRETLDESKVAPDPYRQFVDRSAEAVKSQLHEPGAMALATVAVPCPSHRGGCRPAPEAIDFWPGRASRRHERIRCRRARAHPGAPVIDRLAP